MSGLLSLRGRFVHLLPLGPGHVDALAEVATRDRSTFGLTPVPWDRAAMADYVGRAIAKRQAGEHLPFVTYSVALDRIVGSTRFYDLSRWDWASQGPGAERLSRTDRPDVASIGYTWLDPAAQRTPVNTEAKLLMLDHAFSDWEVWRVGIKTDVRNTRSRRAIERLGLDLDGILRADMPGADGTVRDSAVYSVLAADWPAHRRRLTARLAG